MKGMLKSALRCGLHKRIAEIRLSTNECATLSLLKTQRWKCLHKTNPPSSVPPKLPFQISPQSQFNSPALFQTGKLPVTCLKYSYECTIEHSYNRIERWWWLDSFPAIACIVSKEVQKEWPCLLKRMSPPFVYNRCGHLPGGRGCTKSSPTLQVGQQKPGYVPTCIWCLWGVFSWRDISGLGWMSVNLITANSALSASDSFTTF